MKKVFVRTGDPENGYIPSQERQQFLVDALNDAGVKNAFIGHYALKIFEINGYAKIEGNGIKFNVTSTKAGGRVFVIIFGDKKAGWLPSPEHAAVVEQWFERNFPNCKLYFVPYFSNVSGDFIGEKGIADLCVCDIECGVDYEPELASKIVEIVALANNEI